MRRVHRISRYTESFPVDDGLATVHLISGAVVYFPGLRDSSELLQLGPDNEEPLHSLLDTGIVTNMSEDEELDFAKSLFDELWTQCRGDEGVTLVPTFDCNLSCVYCFQRGRSSLPRLTMTEAERDCVLRYLSKHVPRCLALYGGEPPLEVNTSLMEPVFAFTEEKGVYLHVTTNGTELRSYEQHLGGKRIQDIQVTLDGDEKHHDALRVSKKGDGTWRLIGRCQTSNATRTRATSETCCQN